MNLQISIDELTEEQSKDFYIKIVKALNSHVENHPDDAKEILLAITPALEELELDDFFGTEGLLRD